MVDSLSCTDGSIRAAAQCWLVRALSLNDVIRILEPILLLLLHPTTQRCSIHNIKQNLTAGKCMCLHGVCCMSELIMNCDCVKNQLCLVCAVKLICLLFALKVT